MYVHGRHIRRTAAMSLLATALPSSAFIRGTMISSAMSSARAAATGPRRHLSARLVARRPLFFRGGRRLMNSNVVRNMSGGDDRDRHSKAASDASPFSRPVRNVVVVGGTHGNEYTGVWCIKAIEGQRERYHNHKNNNNNNNSDDRGSEGIATAEKMNGDNNVVNVFERFPTLKIQTLLANPVAFMNNKRFMDADLNRQFKVEKLKGVTIDKRTMEECDVENEFCSDEDADASLPHEAVRAREIDSILGPKFGDDPEGELQPSPAADMVIDLHTTTANMGITLIVPEGDALVAAAAAYVMRECRETYGLDGVHCLMHALPRRRDRATLSSCGRHGFTIEVGPTPQGVLRHDAVEKTQAAMHSLMEFLHLRNLELEGGDGAVGSPLLDELSRAYPGRAVPCHRSAPAKRPGELSGKIRWPNDKENPNFPAYMVHGSLQDRDFHLLRRGDPLFVRPDGTVVPYDGSHGDEVRLVFVNEGGYYYESSGTGIGVAVESAFDWRTGLFLAESDNEGSPVGEVVGEEKDSYR